MATFNTRWTNASGTSAAAVSRERQLWVVQDEAKAPGVIIIWTDDGTTGGTNLFNSNCPWVWVIMQDVKDPRAFTNNGFFGPMYIDTLLSAADQYMWKTEWNSTDSVWQTTVYLGGGFVGADGTHSNEGAGRQFFAYAIGDF